MFISDLVIQYTCCQYNKSDIIFMECVNNLMYKYFEANASGKKVLPEFIDGLNQVLWPFHTHL